MGNISFDYILPLLNIEMFCYGVNSVTVAKIYANAQDHNTYVLK